MSTRYREFPPPPALCPFVECFWVRSPQPARSRAVGEGPVAGGAAGTQSVLPDGCIDIIIDLHERRSAKRVVVVGTMTRPLVVSNRRARNLVAVRFRPGGAARFFPGSMKELTDDWVPLEDLWKREELAPYFGEEAMPRAQLYSLQDLLVARLADAGEVEPRIAAACQLIRRCQGTIAVARLSEALGISRQHLKRLFERHVGVNVKFFSRVVRLQALLRQLERPGAPDWARLAVEAGFFDQSHLITDFRELTGLTPTRFLAR